MNLEQRYPYASPALIRMYNSRRSLVELSVLRGLPQPEGNVVQFRRNNDA